MSASSREEAIQQSESLIRAAMASYLTFREKRSPDLLIRKKLIMKQLLEKAYDLYPSDLTFSLMVSRWLDEAH